MPTTPRKKLIEVALPLEAINVASAREKSIRHGHPSTLHLWWARRPLAAARAVIFSSLVDDPDSPDALPAFVEACKQLDNIKLGYENRNVIANGDTPRMRLFDFIEALVKWESTTNETILNKARELIMIATEGNPPPLLDPFAGGGSIPLEAQRLGLEAHASDLNPVAVMINKAQIEIPPRFANQLPVNPRDRTDLNKTTWKGAAGLAADVRYYGEWLREKAWERIGHLYPKHNGETVIAWIWARTVKCPNPACGAQVPLVQSFWLSRKKGNLIRLVPQVNHSLRTINFIVESGDFDNQQIEATEFGTSAVNSKGKKVKATFICPVCNNATIKGEYIDAEANISRLGATPLAIVTEGNRGRNYYAFDDAEAEIALSGALQYLLENGTDTPNQPARGTFASNAQGRIYGFNTFSDYFTPRQLVALTTFCDTLKEVRIQAYRDAVDFGMKEDTTPLEHGGSGALAYAEAVSVYLAFAVDKGANLWSSITGWMNDRGAFRETFARQGIAIVWDYAEANPFSDSGGNFLQYVERIADALGFLSTNAPGFAVQMDAARLSHSKITKIISTDPPYYDNIGYADLSDYFYVWLRRMLRDIYSDVFNTILVPKTPELIASPYRFNGSREAANEHFEQGLRQVFNHIVETIDPSVPFTIYYAFKQSEDNQQEAEVENIVSLVASTGWETMLTGLIESGLTINGTWPIRTEGSGRLVAMRTNALASSIVLVCRLRPDNAPTISRRQFVDSLRRELPEALKNMQSGNIAPVDLAQASIGPGMAIYSRYSKVLEADGSALTVRAALGLINQELDAYLAEQDGSIDPDTRFAVAWFEQFSFNEGEFGHADVLARAKNTSVAGVEAAGLVVAGRGKVRLKHWTEVDPGAWDPKADRRPTVWEAVHHLIERLNAHGESGAAGLLLKMNAEMAAEARALAYRLYSICERKGWAEHALEYNKLVVSWTGVADQAAADRAAEVRGDGTKQLGLFE